METHAVSKLFLAIPATLILLLLLEYIRRNRGAVAAAAFAATCLGYGILRALGVNYISEFHGVDMPYRMAGSIRVGAASPMELAGWMLAAALAWQAGATLVRTFGGRAGSEPAHRIAFAGALVLAALSLAVETAAIAGGWWDWSIPPPPDEFLRVPAIAMVDWAFVAFDFLLPFLVFSRRSSLFDRAVALSLFPVHFASHWLLKPPFPSVPLSLFELAHFAIPLWVFWRAVGETPFEERARREWGFYVPGLAALLVAADAALTAALARQVRSTVFILPLAIVGALTILVGWRRGAGAVAAPVRAGPRWAVRVGAVLLALALLVFVRLPANRRRDGYVKNFVDGVARLNAGDMAAAERLVRDAATLRPDKAEPRLVLAIVLGNLGRTAEAEREYAEALRIKPALAASDQAKDYGYAKNYTEGVARINRGDMVAAERLLRTAVELRPEKAEAHMVWSIALINLRRADEAKREYAAALRIDPALAETGEAKALREAFTHFP